METPGTYLKNHQELSQQQITASKEWVLNALMIWREKFKPVPTDFIAMAVALETVAGILRSEAAQMPHAPETRT